MTRTTPTRRTLQALRGQGRIAGVVERWNPHAGPLVNGKRVGVRQDLFGFIDVIALDVARGTIIAVQATSTSNASKRMDKIKSECAGEATAWLACGGTIEIWSWRKLKVKRGGKAVRWQPRVESVTLTDLAPGEGPCESGASSPLLPERSPRRLRELGQFGEIERTIFEECEEWELRE